MVTVLAGGKLNIDDFNGLSSLLTRNKRTYSKYRTFISSGTIISTLKTNDKDYKFCPDPRPVDMDDKQLITSATTVADTGKIGHRYVLFTTSFETDQEGSRIISYDACEDAVELVKFQNADDDFDLEGIIADEILSQIRTIVTNLFEDCCIEYNINTLKITGITAIPDDNMILLTVVINSTKFIVVGIDYVINDNEPSQIRIGTFKLCANYDVEEILVINGIKEDIIDQLSVTSIAYNSFDNWIYMTFGYHGDDFVSGYIGRAIWDPVRKSLGSFMEIVTHMNCVDVRVPYEFQFYPLAVDTYSNGTLIIVLEDKEQENYWYEIIRVED